MLMTKNVFDFNEFVSSTRGGIAGAAGGIFGAATDIVGGIVDGATAIFSRNIAIQLISATKTDGFFLSIYIYIFLLLSTYHMQNT